MKKQGTNGRTVSWRRTIEKIVLVISVAGIALLLALLIGIATGDLKVVAVASASMHHTSHLPEWWNYYGHPFAQYGVDEETFAKFPFAEGFNPGDLFIIRRATREDIRMGDVVLYRENNSSDNSSKEIIHRYMGAVTKGNSTYLVMKGDVFIVSEYVPAEQIIGKAVIRAPYIGRYSLLRNPLWREQFLKE